VQTTGNATLDAALAEAIEDGAERTTRWHLRIDWDDNGSFDHEYSDVSELVSSLSVDRARLQTDLPASVNKFTGFSSNELTVTLSGKRDGDDVPVSQWISRYYTASPFYGQNVTGRKVKLNVIEETSAGEVETRLFTGILRSVSIERASGAVKIVCGDALYWNTQTVILPHWAHDSRVQSTNWDPRRPINSGWVFEEVMRQCGTDVGPPARTDAALYCSFAGSMLPSVGNQADYVYAVSGEYHGLPYSDTQLMTSGKFGPTLAAASGSGVTRQYAHNIYRASKPLYVPANGTTNGPVNVGFTLWAYSDGTAAQTIPAANGTDIWYHGTWVGLSLTASQVPSIGAHIQVGKNGQPFARVVDNAKAPRWGWAAQPQGWHAYNFIFKFRNNSIDVECRVDGVLQTRTSGEGAQTTGYVYSPGGIPDGFPQRIQVYKYDPSSHLQVYWDGSGTVDWQPGQDYPKRTVDNLPWADWTGCLSELSYIPDTTYVNAWEILQKLAEAEFAFLRVNEYGQLAYKAAYDWHNTRTLAGVREITVEDIEGMSTEPTYDQFANRVEAPYDDVTCTVDEVWKPNSPYDLYMVKGQVTQQGPFKPSKPVIRGTSGGTNVAGWSTYNRQKVDSRGDTVTVQENYPWRTAAWTENESYASGVWSTDVTTDMVDYNRDGYNYDQLVLTPTFFYSNDKREVVVQGAATNWSTRDDGRASPPAVYYGAQLVDTSSGGAAGDNSVPGILFSLKGLTYGTEKESTYIGENADSIAAYGVKTLQLDKHVWRQGAATMAAIIPLLLEDVASPTPTIEGLRLPLDQRLVHGDVVELYPEDSYSGVVRGQIVGIQVDGFSMTLDIRLLATPAVWLLGVEGSSELDTTAVLS